MSNGMLASSPEWPHAIVRAARPTQLRGSVIEAPLPDVGVGEICVLRTSAGSPRTLARAQVIGFTGQSAVLGLLGQADGLSRAVLVEPTGASMSIRVSDHVLGCVLDANGDVCARLGPGGSDDPDDPCGAEVADRDPAPERRIESRDVDPAGASCEKRPVDAPFATGVRVIDGVLGMGIGQRIAVLAPAGLGKSSLLQMIGANTTADVIVYALVGERGREVAESIARLAATPAACRSVLVRATSDAAAVERMVAAHCAMTVAEYFRDQGRHVLLLVDSLTRYARALRDVALAAGELPARHGYPASVFERLPRLLERAGNTDAGSITAVFAVLIESEDEPDPIGHEVMSILDGHLILSSQLAAEGRFPAIDIARSTSRVSRQIATRDDLRRASEVRRVLARAAELSLLVELGEYREGVVADDDRALACARKLKVALTQSPEERSPIHITRSAIDAALL